MDKQHSQLQNYCARYCLQDYAFQRLPNLVNMVTRKYTRHLISESLVICCALDQSFYKTNKSVKLHIKKIEIPAVTLIGKKIMIILYCYIYYSTKQVESFKF